MVGPVVEGHEPSVMQALNVDSGRVLVLLELEREVIDEVGRGDDDSDSEGVEVIGAVTDEGEAAIELSGEKVDGILEAAVAPEEPDRGMPLDVATDGETDAEAVSLAPEVNSDGDGERVSVAALEAASPDAVSVSPGGGLVLPP